MHRKFQTEYFQLNEMKDYFIYRTLNVSSVPKMVPKKKPKIKCMVLLMNYNEMQSELVDVI